MAMQRQEPAGRDGRQPRRQRKRRSLRDCDVYMRTGECKLGMTCLFNHPSERQQLQFIQQKLNVLGMEEYPESLVQPECQKVLQEAVQEVLETLKYFTGNLSAGDSPSHDTGPPCSLDPSSSPVSEFYSLVQGELRGCCRLDSSSELESVIEESRGHWSELSSNSDSDCSRESSCEVIENDADHGTGESNREIFESLRQLPKYQTWLNCDVALADISWGPKIAEGGQAEIFEVESCSRRGGLGSVLKVFKKGYSLQDLKFQWPDGLLFDGQFTALFQGGMVLEDDRFALLLLRSDMDLLKLIDAALDKDSPLFDCFGTPRLKELRAYKSKCARSECSTPVFSEECAERIMYRIAKELECLHSEYSPRRPESIEHFVLKCGACKH